MDEEVVYGHPVEGKKGWQKSHLGSIPISTVLCALGTSLPFYKPQFPHLYNGITTFPSRTLYGTLRFYS